MIKVLNQYFPGRLFVLLVTENLLILLGIWIGISYQTGDLRWSLLSYPTLFGKAILINLTCQFCLYYADVYDLRNIGSRLEIGLRTLQALGAAALILATLYAIFPEMRLGAGIVETAIVAIVCGILVWRIFIEWLNRAYGAGERILLVGSGDAVHSLIRELRGRPDLPITLIGTVDEEGYAGSAVFPNLSSLGTLKDLGQIIKDSSPDRLIVALKERRQQLPIDLLLSYRMRGLVIEEASALYQKLTGKVPVESIRPSALIFSDGFSQSTLQKIYGRLLGFIAAVLALIFVGPFLLLIAAVIKLDSRGPALYKQSRVGLNGELFDVLKFRSMRMDAEATSGPVWAQDVDPRITRVGRFLRKVRLDELPQLINVLYGHMSFVGPRPERPFFVDLLKDKIPFYDLRHAVRPGITGWAQVSCHYGATVEDAQQKLEYDLFYIKNFSLSFDSLILFQTIKIVLFGRGAR
ncbi:MAG: tuaA [Acidobacteriales bacterium]|nr:tuaA [Terriglobales bacterium]